MRKARSAGPRSRGDAGWDRALLGDCGIGYARYELDAGAMRPDTPHPHPEQQRRGYGAPLLAQVERAARARGGTAVRRNVDKRDTNASAAYRNSGHAIVESAIADLGGGFVMDGCVMQRKP